MFVVTREFCSSSRLQFSAGLIEIKYQPVLVSRYSCFHLLHSRNPGFHHTSLNSWCTSCSSRRQTRQSYRLKSQIHHQCRHQCQCRTSRPSCRRSPGTDRISCLPGCTAHCCKSTLPESTSCFPLQYLRLHTLSHLIGHRSCSYHRTELI